MEVKKIDTLDYKDWDQFVNHSNNGTIFHTLKFLKYHKKGKYNFHNLAFFDHGQIIAVLPGALNDGFFKSPAGASYGSFVTKDGPFNMYEEIFDSFLNYAKDKDFKEIFMTPPPIFYSKRQHEILEYLFHYKGFLPKIDLITNAVNISIFNDNIMDDFTPMHRRAVKRSFQYEVIVEINEDYKNFYTMLIENKKKFNTLPTHTFEELRILFKLFPEQMKLLMAYDKNKKPLAGIVFMLCNTNTTLAFYISHYFKYQQYRAVNRLFYELVKWSMDNQYNWLDLGVSMDTSNDNQMEPSRSLILFKEGINTRGFRRSTFIKKL